MTDSASKFHSIVDQLHALTATLTASTSTVERHKLLRQYRELLEQADKAATLEERAQAIRTSAKYDEPRGKLISIDKFGIQLSYYEK